MNFWERFCKVLCVIIEPAIKLFVIGSLLWLAGLAVIIWLF